MRGGEGQMQETLNQDDVVRLMSDRSVDSRAVTARKLGVQYARAGFSDAQKSIADQIIRLLARDTDNKVRQTLAEVIKGSDKLPPDIAKGLARDIDPVAIPILQFSPVLSDDDLIEIIEQSGETKHIAISKRAIVSRNVSDTLIATAREAVVQSLLENQGSDIGDESLYSILDRMGHSEAIREALVHRRRLPVELTEKLISAVSDQLRAHLIEHHELPADLADQLAAETHDRATVDVLSEPMSEDEIDPLVAQLQENGRLTPSLVIRSLCLGNFTFFYAALARRAAIPSSSARRLLDGGDIGAIDALLHKADIAPASRGVVNIAITEARNMDFDGDVERRDTFFQRVFDKIRACDEFIEPDDLAYLQNRMSQSVQSGY